MRRRLIVSLLISASFIFTGIFPVWGEELQIARVMLSGNRFVPADDIYPHIHIQEGTTYTRSELEQLGRDAIKELFATGLFADIKIDWDAPDWNAEAAKNVVVTFLLSENPVVSEVNVIGIEEMDSDRVLDAILVKEGSPLTAYSLKLSENAIKDLYNEEGYFKVTVETSTEPDPANNSVVVNFTIHEERKIRVGEITLKYTEGQGFWEGLVERWRRSWRLETTSGKPYNPETLDRDVANILRDLRNEGYWGAEVKPDLTFNASRTRVFIILTITHGEKYSLEEIRISGNEVLSTEELMEDVTFQPGMVFKEKFIYETIYQLRSRYEAQGYANVLIEPQYTPTEGNSFILKLDITEGDVFYIGNITVLGLQTTREKLVLRELKFDEGDRYDGDALKMSERNLVNLGYFENIHFEMKPGAQPNTRDVYVSMTEAKTGSLSVGMAYSKLDHLMGLLEVKKRNFSATDFWTFTGRGQNLDLRTEYGGRRRNFYIGWSDPWFNDNLDDTLAASPDVPIFLGLTGFDLTHEWDGYDEGHFGGSLKLGRPLYDDYTNGYMTYGWERIDVDNIENASAPTSIIDDGERHDRASSLNFEIVRNTIDNNWDPHTGYKIYLGNKITGGFLGGTVDHNRPTLDVSYMYPMTEKTTLAWHMWYSFIDNPFTAAEVPEYELIYLGGSNSVRGYPERSLAIYPGDNGGHTGAYFNLEWRFPLVKDMLGGLLFVDGGNVYAPPSRVVLGDFKYGIGFGFRLKIMGMPLRLDYGFRLDESEPGLGDSHKGEIHFSFGQVF